MTGGRRTHLRHGTSPSETITFSQSGASLRYNYSSSRFQPSSRHNMSSPNLSTSQATTVLQPSPSESATPHAAKASTSVTRGTIHVLRLKPEKSVQWEAGTIDNEHLHRRSTKEPCIVVWFKERSGHRVGSRFGLTAVFGSCCIFHKTKQFGESSTESSCGENSDVEEEEEAKKSTREKPKQRRLRRLDDSSSLSSA